MLTTASHRTQQDCLTKLQPYRSILLKHRCKFIWWNTAGSQILLLKAWTHIAVFFFINSFTIISSSLHIKKALINHMECFGMWLCTAEQATSPVATQYKCHTLYVVQEVCLKYSIYFTENNQFGWLLLDVYLYSIITTKCLQYTKINSLSSHSPLNTNQLSNQHSFFSI